MYRKWGRTKPPPGATVDYGHPLVTGLVGCWLLNEGAGANAFDLSPRRYNGTLISAPTWRAGRLGGPSLAFASNYVTMGNVLNFERFDAFSLAAWFRTIGTGNEQVIGKEDSGSPFRGYQLVMNAPTAGRMRFGLINNGAGADLIAADSTGTFNDGRWHHAVGVSYGTGTTAGLRLYMDGALAPVSLTGTLTNTIVTTSPFQISGRNGANIMLTGAADVGMVWNRALSPQEARWLYEEPFAMIRSPRSIQYFVPATQPAAPKVPSGGDGGELMLDWMRKRRDKIQRREPSEEQIKLPPIAVLMEALEDWT